MKMMKKSTARRILKGLNTFVVLMMVLQPVGTPSILRAIAADEPATESVSAPAPVSDPAPKEEPKSAPVDPVAPKEEPAPAPAPDPTPVPKEEPKTDPAPSTTIDTPKDAETATPAGTVTTSPAQSTDPAPSNPLTAPALPTAPQGDSTSAPTNTDTPVSPAIDSTPTISPDAASTEAPAVEATGKICLEQGANIVSSDRNDWTVSGDISETKNKVELGVKYVFPGNDNVSVTFTCLPAASADRTTLKIQQIASADINLPEGVVAASDFAYDITTGMKDGDFKYDLTLPKSDVASADINYIEKSANEVTTQEVATTDLKSVDDTKVKTETKDVKVSDLDHFTIFIATYADIGLVTSEFTYLQGDTVYTNSTSLDSSKYYKVDIIEQDGSTRHSAAACTTGGASLSGSYALSDTAPVGTSWKAEITKYNNSTDCGSRSNIQDTGTATFEVKSTTPTPLTNPTISQTCGLDIALVIDNSNSIDSSELSQMKTAMTGFVNALAGTPTEFSVTKFGTNASVIQSFTSNTTDVNNAINGVNQGGGGTNWKEGIASARGTFDPGPKPNLMIFASDGNPTFPDCGGSVTCATDVNSAVTEANTAKSSNIRMLVLGIGEVILDSGDSLRVENLKAISGHVVNGSTVLGSDVVTTNFSGMASQLAAFASQTCGGTITVNKYYDSVDPNNRGGAGWQYNIAGTSKTTDSNGQTAAVEVNSGSGYSVTETNMLSGYSYGNASCKKSTGASVGSPVTNGIGNITMGNDDIISCDFVNTRQPTTGTLTVNKILAPSNDLGKFNLRINGNTAGTGSNVGNGGTTGPITVNSGAHTVSETQGTSTNLSDYTSVIGGDCATSGSVTVNAGQNKVCTITNTRNTGTLIVKKVVVNDNGGGENANDFTFKVNGGNSITFTQSTNNLHAENNLTVNAGTYGVVEDATIPGYATTYNNCTGIVLANGGTATCTITNDDVAPTLTLVKIVVNNNGGQAAPSVWTLSATGTLGSFSGHGPTVGPTSVPAGVQYTLGESGGNPFNYAAGDWVCNGGSQDGNKITLSLADNATCTIINDDKPATLIVKKVVVGSNAPATNFSFSVNGGGSQSFEADGQNDLTVNRGTYTVTESPVSDYTTTYSTDCTNGVVENGETITCTITNTRNTGFLLVHKQYDSDGNGTYDIVNDSTANTAGFRWGLSSTPASNINSFGAPATTLDTGSYNVYENTLANYHPTGYYRSTSEQASCTNTDGSALPALVDVSTGQTTEITICNARDMGTLTVIKHVVGGTDDASAWTMFVRSDPSQNAITPFLGSETGTTNNLPTDTYTITELGMEKDLSNYTLTYSGDCNPQGQVTVIAGTSKTCTLTNTRDAGSIKVNKLTDTDGDGTFETSNPGNFTWSADGTGTHAMEATVSGFTTGAHSINENTVSGYHLATWYITADTTQNCNNSSRTLPADITVNKDQTSEITICNAVDNGHLIVQKTTIPSGDPTIFNVYVSGTGTIIGNPNGPITDSSDKDYEVAPGTYSAVETGLDDWAVTDNTCQDVVVGAGETKYCTITNTKQGKIIIEKQTTPNTDTTTEFGFTASYNSTFPLLKNMDTNDSGYLAPGPYTVAELVKTGWDLTNTVCTSNIENNDGVDRAFAIDPANISLRPGENIACTFTNTQRGTVTVTKFNDLDGNGVQDQGEEVLPDWAINLAPTQGTATTQNTDANGQTSFSNLLPVGYNLSENIQSGWNQTNISCQPADRIAEQDSLDSGYDSANQNYSLTVKPGETRTCSIGNQFVAPSLVIEKSNNNPAPGIVLAPGDSVVYTLKVTAKDNDVNGVTVTDLPPDGFTYVPGSETASSDNSGHVGALTLQHAYASPGVWDLGDMKKDEVVTLTYKTNISTSQESGTYPDLAWTAGKSLVNADILGTGENSQYVDGAFVGTQVAVVKQGTVLGASVKIPTDKETDHKKDKIVKKTRVLPATGYSPWWIVVAILILLSGAILIYTGKRKKKEDNPDDNGNNNMNTMAKLLVAGLIGVSVLFGANAANAADIAARMMTPDSPYQTTDFDLGFVALDLNSNPVTVQCFLGSSGTPFQTVNLAGGGTSGNCNVNSSVIPGSGSYQFHITATNGSESITSPDVSLEVITGGPGTPTNYNRDKVSACQNVISFTTANDDGKTVRAEIYRSTERAYTADASTLVTSIDVGSDQPASYTDIRTENCNTVYYAVRAFDALGNGSGVVSDTRTVTVTTGGGTTTVMTTTTAPGGGAIPVAGGGAVSGAATGGAAGGTVEGAQTPSGEGQTPAGEEQQGEVLGEQTTNEAGLTGFRKHPYLYSLAGLIVLYILYYAYRKMGKKGHLKPPIDNPKPPLDTPPSNPSA